MTVLPIPTNLSPEHASSGFAASPSSPSPAILADCLLMSFPPRAEPIIEEEKNRSVEELECRVRELEATVQDCKKEIQHNLECIKDYKKQFMDLEKVIVEKGQTIAYQTELLSEKHEDQATTSRDTIDQDSASQLEASVTVEDQMITQKSDLIKMKDGVEKCIQTQEIKYRGTIKRLRAALHKANTIIGDRNATNDFVVEQVVDLEEKNKKLVKDNERLTGRALYLEAQFRVRKTEGIITVPGRGLQRSFEAEIEEPVANFGTEDSSSEDPCA